MDTLAALQYGVALSFLVYASIEDVKTRSIPGVPLALFIVIEAVLLALRVLSGYRVPPLYLAIDALLVAFMWVLVLLCYKGPGDLMLYAGLVLSEPGARWLLPAPLTLLSYYSLLPLVAIPYNIARNLLDSRARRLLSREPILRRIYLAATAVPVPARRALSMRWWIPVDIREARASICSEEYEPWQFVKRALDSGRLRPDDYIWVTYGVPAAVPMLLAYVMLLLVGDGPITLLLSRLFGPKP